MRNTTKRLIVFRAFALANLGFVCVGLWRLGFTVARPVPFLSAPNATYVREFFYLLAAISVLLLAGMVYSGWRLWVMLPGAVWHSTVIFAAIIFYNLFLGMSWGLPDPWGSSIALAVVAGGNLALRALNWTGYPLLAILGLNLVRHYTRLHSPEPVPRRSSSARATRK